MNREIKFRIIYQSPNTDEPNQLFISEPLSINDIMFSEDTQVDFIGGSYLRFNELEEESTKWVQYIGLKDKNGTEYYVKDIAKLEDGSIYHIESLEDFWHEDGYSDGCLEDELKNGERVGNKFENPELLKEESDEKRPTK